MRCWMTTNKFAGELYSEEGKIWKESKMCQWKKTITNQNHWYKKRKFTKADGAWNDLRTTQIL